jgi:DNA processing protein
VPDGITMTDLMPETTTENIRTALALAQLPKVGRVRLRKMLAALALDARTGEVNVAEAVRKCAAALKLGEFSPADIDMAVRKADELYVRCEALHVRVHAFAWPSYPQQLARLSDPPALLFSIGPMDSEEAPRVAVIGTRKPTEWGLRTAHACAAQIADAGGVVVSGLALGIDAASHAAVVEHHRPTWAVLAHGLHTVSPSSNRELAKQIVAEGGALLSEYAPGEPAQRFYFVERDRIQAGLVDAVLVIESDVGGGAMHTVRFAHEAGVPVWVTFPHEEMEIAETQATTLPEPHQGTWALLRTKNAVRVESAKALRRMLVEAREARRSSMPIGVPAT